MAREAWKVRLAVIAGLMSSDRAGAVVASMGLASTRAGRLPGCGGRRADREGVAHRLLRRGGFSEVRAKSLSRAVIAIEMMLPSVPPNASMWMMRAGWVASKLS